MKKTDRVLMVLYWVLVALAATSLITTFPKVGMSAIAVSIVSFFLGFVTKAGVLRVQGRQVRVPLVERSRTSFTGLVVVMLSLSLVSIFQVQGVIDRSEDCNRQFRSALTYNASLNQETSALNDKREVELAHRRAAQDSLINTLGPDRVATPEALAQYRSVATVVEQRLNELDERRMDAQRTRAAYPAPTCGLT